MERIFCKIKRVKRKLDGKRITAKVMSAVLIASSMLNAFAPVAAYAAEPELATVSLSETQHGKLSFDGTEDMTLAVEVGTDVTVNVTPDEGYFSDGITVFKGEEDGKAVDVKDGKATFTVEGDTIVTSTFYQNGSLGSAPLKAADVDEGKAVKSVEDYIRKNADAKYVGKSDNLARADVLTVTTSVVDGSKLPDATLDSLWADDNGDGFSEHWDALMSQAVSHAVLFEADPDSDYYVGWAGADITDAKLTDWGAAENNADAKMRDGFIVDDATGLVYVPKSYTEKDDSGKPMVASSRIQLLYTAKDANAEATFDFDATSDGVSGDVSGKGKVTVPATSPTTEVVIANDGEARKAVNGRTIDSVTVNGIEYTPDMGMWQYDSETGALEFAMAPAGIHAMSVKMSDGFGKDVASFFRMPEPRMSVNEIGTWEFKTAPTVGATFVTKGHNRYSSKTRPGYTLPAVENPAGGRYENKTINQAMGWQPVNLDALKAGNYSIEWTSEIWAQDTGWVKIGNEARVALTCGHVGVDPSFNSNPGYNDTAHKDNNHGQHIRVFSVSGNEAVIGVTVPTAMTQAGAGFFRIRWRIGSGKLKIHKASANASITNGNDCYSLEGAEFAVLNAAGQNMGTLRTDANGDTNTLELPEGTYTVRETKPPKGYLPAPDQQVTVRGGQQTTAQVSDDASYDPVRIVLGKFDGDKEYNANNLPQGSASLEGAEFTIEYFDTVDYDSYDALKKAGVNPTRSWVVRTNEKGRANLDKNSIVSGDELYYQDGIPILPRGSVAMYESKAPTGYKLNPEVSFQKIQDNYLEGVTTFNMPEIPESVKRGGVSVQKLDAETDKVPQGSASLEGIGFSIINDNENTVKVDGKTYAKGETVKVITTDAKGFATTGADTLPYGDYIIRETKTNGSYLNTSAEMRVQVREDGKVYSFNAKDDIVRVGVEITKHDIETGTGDPLGGASLDGTQFQIKSLNDKPVIVGGVTYSKGQVIQPLLTIEDGHASSDAQWLPFGLYSIQEVKAGEGYLLTDGEPHEFRIAKDGVLVNPFDGAFENQVMRSDLEFTKKGDDGQDRLAGVAFKLTSKTTGESHVAVTDGNGYFSSASSWNKHTHETNGNDWALKTDGVIDSSKLDDGAGIWFGGTKPDDSKGALPYDTYAIEELRCTANEGYQLIETTVIIGRDGKVYDFGTLTDVKASITTKAYDPMDGDSLVGMGEVKVSDKVTYANLFPNRDYKLTAELHDSATGDVLLDASGHPITVEKRFTAQSPTGFEVVEFTIDTIALGGKTITVYEKLYDDGGSLIAEHTDKSDVNQQVTVIEPEIGTTAVDGADGDKNVATDDKATVTDRVAYKNLIPGKEYTVKGTLHIKKTDDEGKVTEEILKVDGKPVTAETTFTPEKSDGKVEVTFTFDSTGIPQDTEMVAFESLEKNGVELVAHADIEDGKQTTTAHVTGISTTATDGLDGDKNVIADAETTITDDVAYENALTGIGYTMTGILMDAETGLPILTGDGSEKYTEADVAAFMQQLLDVLGLSAQDEDEGIADIVVSDETAEDGSVKKSQTVRVHADGTFEVIDTTYETDEDGLTSATVDASGKVGYDALTDEQKKAVSDVAVLKDSGIVLNYSATGELPVSIDMDALGKFIADNEDLISHLVYQTAEFTPEKYDGTVTMDFHFNANDVIDRLGGETKDIVVFEVMSKNAVADEEGSAPVIVASECDLDSEEQTVNLVPTVIGTTATDKSDGDHTLMAGKDAVITDRVTYEGLIPGKEYTLKATLMDKKTGEMLSINDQHVTAELKFTPNSQNGTIDIDLGKFDASSLDGHDLVVFEELYKQTEQGNEATEVLVAEHKDIDDEGQTVTVTTTPPGGFFGKTGGNDFFIVVSIAALAVLACGCAYYGIKNRRAAKAEDAAVDEGGDTDNGDVSGDSEA